MRFFFEQQPILAPTTQFAAIGQGTANAIKAYHKTVAYTALPNDDFSSFADLANAKKVLFPQAANSLQSVQKAIVHHLSEVHNLVVYNNQPASSSKIPACDMLLFTSPLNAQTYCKTYGINANQKVIAIGKTTAAALQKLGYANIQTPYAYDEMSMAAVCY